MQSAGHDPQLSLEHILARIAVVDGWWQSDERLADDDWTPEKDYRYRTLFENRDRFLGGVSYEKARVGYRIGRLAARNPRYEDRSFETVEEEIRSGWPESAYGGVRPFVKLGFERARFSRALERSRRRVEKLEAQLHDPSGAGGGDDRKPQART